MTNLEQVHLNATEEAELVSLKSNTYNVFYAHEANHETYRANQRLVGLGLASFREGLQEALGGQLGCCFTVTPLAYQKTIVTHVGPSNRTRPLKEAPMPRETNRNAARTMAIHAIGAINDKDFDTAKHNLEYILTILNREDLDAVNEDLSP